MMSEINQNPVIQRGWLRALVFIPILLVCILLFSMPLYWSGLLKESDSSNIHTVSNIYNQLAVITGTLLAIYLCRRFIDRKDFLSLGFQFDWIGFLKGCGLGIFLITLGWSICLEFGWIEARFLSFNFESLGFHLILMVLVAIAEEVMCRTYLLSNLSDSLNKYVALTIVALIFALLHYFNPDFTWMSFTELVLAGLLLGLWYIHRQNIWFPIGLHFTWNYFQGSIYGFEISGQKVVGSILEQRDVAESFYSGGLFGLEGSIAGIFVTVLGIVGTEYYLQRKPAA